MMRTHTYSDGKGHLVIENVNDAGRVISRTVLPEGTPVHTGSDDVQVDNSGDQD
ncbi:hypothetical protein [Saccharopolyspora mangrovi]|uniref:Uncharacterized protein n=1 Tax=Saccharopolyspora mangrovi TaxID=3082379 RepID=A0ABU6A997_9PSEU|nr:hypothetical protein [Saccharopolyspora sp. S2-29]MEB3368066.1 hypothetical protein [Saccharopolyspora sp. S2-29]